jgi:ribosomal protein S18 acetylase RimI-like enzyme
MRPVSMTFRTEMIFWRAEAEVLDRGDYWLVRTPSNPTYYGGNLLVFNHPPAAGDYHHWLELFEREFKEQPEVRHLLFMWDMPESESGTIAPFVDGGFEIQSNLMLLATAVNPPPKVNNEIEVRRIETEDEWEAVLASKIRLRNPRFELESYALFKRRWLEVRRKLAARGQGDWYGAFIGDRLVGDLGLFCDGTVARFQDVGTEPDFQRRGICGTLVYEVAKRALESAGVESLVMVADENYHAARIYESVGFKPLAQHAVACRYPPQR